MTNENDQVTTTLTYNSSTGNPDGHLLGLTKLEYFAGLAMQGLTVPSRIRVIAMTIEKVDSKRLWL